MESEKFHSITELFNMIFGYMKPMILKCAVDLGIPDVICNHGQPMTLSQLHSALSLPISKKPYLLHLLRTLTHFGFIRVQAGATVDSEATYDLTSASRLLVNSEGSLNLLPFFHSQLGIQDVTLKAFLCMGDWLKQDDTVRTPFEMAHGSTLWEMASKNTKINDKFNSAMESYCTILSDAMLKYSGDIFKGVESLVDVAGGVGGMSKAIAANFPHVQCTVLDLPHVVDGLKDGTVKFLGGDMFDYIPPADAVLLKSVLHGLGDEDSIKLLRQCKEAVSGKEAVKGKVIILEPVVGSSGNAAVEETQVLFDMLMLTANAGAERDEQEWKSLFTKAGYSSHKIVHSFGFTSIIEVYP